MPLGQLRSQHNPGQFKIKDYISLMQPFGCEREDKPTWRYHHEKTYLGGSIERELLHVRIAACHLQGLGVMNR